MPLAYYARPVRRLFLVIEQELPVHLKASSTGLNMLTLNFLMIGGLALGIGVASQGLAESGSAASWTIPLLGADLSRRTMERRLAAEGTTFYALLDEVRSEVARGQLTGSTRNNAEIADLLGFASSASFTAWFAARHGLPLSWRRKRALLL